MSRRIAPARRALAAVPERRGFLKRALAALAGGAALATSRRAAAGTLSSDPYVGEIMITAATFVPQGWLPCDGRLLPIASYTDLFSIIGTTYGGDGQTTFALPDLRSRAAMHMGQGVGLSSRALGETGGQEAVALSANTLPVHDHPAIAGTASGTSDGPTNLYPAQNAAGNLVYGNGADTQLGAGTSSTGANQPHGNMQPFLGLQYCIAPNGVYPSRA